MSPGPLLVDTPLPDPVLTNDGSNTLDSLRYGETYHSTFGALTEARHVFLNAAGVSQRLKSGLPTRVLEIGFGLGLNTLLTADLASQFAAQLSYHAFENQLVAPEVIRQLDYASLLSTRSLQDTLLSAVARMHEHYVESGTARHHRHYKHHSHHCQLADTVQLTVHLEDASKADFKALFQTRFQTRFQAEEETETQGETPGETQGDAKRETDFHAIYLDAFSPDTNAECWQPAFIASLAEVLASDGILSTYSAKGDVRRALLAAGLRVTRLSGPPGKREILIGHWN